MCIGNQISIHGSALGMGDPPRLICSGLMIGDMAVMVPCRVIE